MSSIAVLNAGSSSIKLAVYDYSMRPALLLRGQIEGLGMKPRARLFDAHGKMLSEESFSDSNFDHDQATRALVRIGSQWLEGRSISAVGHRVVHGGPDYTAPLLVSEAVVEKLESFIPLAPLHQPHNLAPIRTLLAPSSGAAAGRLLRHSLSRQPATDCASLCDSQTLFAGRGPALRFFTEFRMNTSRRASAEVAPRDCAAPPRHRASRQRREPLRRS